MTDLIKNTPQTQLNQQLTTTPSADALTERQMAESLRGILGDPHYADHPRPRAALDTLTHHLATTLEQSRAALEHGESGPMEDGLILQARFLNAIFHQLLVDNAAQYRLEGSDKCLLTALNIQRQYRLTAEALRRIAHKNKITRNELKNEGAE